VRGDKQICRPADSLTLRSKPTRVVLSALKLPYQDNISALIHEPSFYTAAHLR